MAKASTKANVTLSLTDKMSGSIKKISGKLKNIGVASTAMGTAIGASLLGAAAKFASTGDQLDKLSKKTGFSVQSLSELSHAASKGGVDFDTFADSMKDMSKFAGDLATGSSGAITTLNNLGISAEEFSAASPEERLNMMADSMQGMTDPAKKAALVMQVMGEAGYKMLPALSEGSEGLAKMRQEANDLGVTMGDDAASNAAMLTNSLGTLKDQVMAVVINIGGALAPALVMIQQYISPIIAKVIAFIKENKMLVVAAGAVAVALVAIGTALAAVGLVIPLIMTALGAMFSPWVIGIGLAVAALVGLISYFVDFKAVMESVQAYADSIWGDMLQGWKGITDAVSSGDLGLAFQIAMKSAEIAVFEGLDRLWSGWRDFGTSVVDMIRDVIKSITGLWSKGVSWIADKIIKVGMAVGLIDEATGKQMLIESANIGEERGERIDSSIDSFADGIVNELKKDREDLSEDLTNLTDEAAEQAAAAAPEPVEVPKPAEIAATVPKALIDSQGTTGGSSAASVVSQLASDNVQRDQLSELKKLNDGIDKLDKEQKPVVGA